MSKEVQLVGYCVRCRKVSKMKDTKEEVLKSGMRAAKGNCIKCNTKMCKILGKDKKNVKK